MLKKIYFITLIILLSACSDRGYPDLEKYVAKIKKETNPSIDEMIEFKHIPKYVYDARNLRDPFTPLTKLGRGEQIPDNTKTKGKKKLLCPIKPDINRVKTGTLEDKSLSDLQMVGTLKIKGTLWALIRLKLERTLFKVKKRDYIGDNFGRIINISNDSIEIQEQLSDGKGCWKTNLTKLKLINRK
ncbi:MAG: pilus assembly protein PilP [Thiomargarita sp.]|nr:pilus assembly protein PilP [Thiomargarita sp.]